MIAVFVLFVLCCICLVVFCVSGSWVVCLWFVFIVFNLLVGLFCT